MRILSTLFVLSAVILPTHAQRVLTLDSCRAMATRNNKQLSIARVKQNIALNTRKAARTKYLPKLDILGGYELSSKEISLLNDGQKTALNNLGSNIVSNAGSGMSSVLGDMVGQGMITADQASALGQMFGKMSAPVAEALDQVGQDIRKAFRTNNRNMFAASVMLRQPIYVGGAITTANRIAELNERLAADGMDAGIQNVLYDVDQAYWLAVSLTHKERLAKSFFDLVKKLDEDVTKMIKEGVATRADGLKVKVKVNEAEMSLVQAEDGVSLAKMLLCQRCGLPLDEDIVLDGENDMSKPMEADMSSDGTEVAMANRPELQMLQTAVDISRETIKLIRAENLPQVALTGGYMVTNPNVYNGYENRFAGVWNIGLLVRIPVWNWMEGAYKVRASKSASAIAAMELDEAREMIELQVNQNKFRVREAGKKLALAAKNVEKAEENLRCANLGFSEGVMQATEVMEAQTAWLQAQTQLIDADIDVRLTRVGLRKALGTLR